MIKIKHLRNYLDLTFPSATGESWDVNGLILGNEEKNLSSVLIALDLTTVVMKKAIEKHVSLIITHHPFFFEDTIEKEFKSYPYKKAIFTSLKNTNIAYYALHTPYDLSPVGMHKTIAKQFFFSEQISFVRHTKYGVVIGLPKPLTLFEITKKIKKNLKVENLKFAGNNMYKAIKKIGIVPGSGKTSDLLELSNKGAELLITSDIKWSEWLTYNEHDLTLIEVPHNIENFFVENLAKIIHNKFNELFVLKCFAPHVHTII